MLVGRVTRMASSGEKHTVKKYKGFGTASIHCGMEFDPHTGAVMTPISLSTTFAQKSPGVKYPAVCKTCTHTHTLPVMQQHLHMCVCRCTCVCVCVCVCVCIVVWCFECLFVLRLTTAVSRSQRKHTHMHAKSENVSTA